MAKPEAEVTRIPCDYNLSQSFILLNPNLTPDMRDQLLKEEARRQSEGFRPARNPLMSPFTHEQMLEDLRAQIVPTPFGK